MKNLTEEEIQKAFLQWRRHYHHEETDDKLKEYLRSERNFTWLTDIRHALFLSAEAVAKKMQMSRSAYSQLEQNEITGSMTLTNLQRAAEAMDCELVYAIRPKNRKPCAEIIWETLLPQALKHPWLNACDQTRRHAALAGIARRQMQDPKYRKAQGWTRQQKI